MRLLAKVLTGLLVTTVSLVTVIYSLYKYDQREQNLSIRAVKHQLTQLEKKEKDKIVEDKPEVKVNIVVGESTEVKLNITIKDILPKKETRILVLMDNLEMSKEFKDCMICMSDSIENITVFFHKLHKSGCPDLHIIMHTFGGSAHTCRLITKFIKQYTGKVTAFIPYYSYSSGTHICLACDKLYVAPLGQISAIDAQILYNDRSSTKDNKNSAIHYYSAVDYKLKDKNKDFNSKPLEERLQMEQAGKWCTENIELIKDLQKNNPKIDILIDKLASGKYPHCTSFMFDDMISFGMNPQLGVPDEYTDIIDVLLTIEKTYFPKQDLD